MTADVSVARSVPVPPPASSGRGRILVIDDESAIVEILVQALSDHDVTGETSARAGMLRCLERDWDLVLCDLMMPDLTGMDVWEGVLAARPQLAARFVFLTGGAFTPRARRFLAEHPVQRLDKPFSLKQVRGFVADWLAGSGLGGSTGGARGPGLH